MPLLDRASRHTVSLFEIRLDNDVIVLRGSPSEASGAVLKGVLTFCLQDPLSVKGIHLRLIGVEKVVGHHDASKTRGVKAEKVIYEKDWQFINFDQDHKKSYMLNPGNYEYPFEHILPGNIGESVEGLDAAYVVYRMKATIERSRFQQDISTKKHVRIVRTLAPGDEALSTTMTVENTWPQKCQYTISIPAKACVFGTTVPVEIGITPLLKGLTIGDVTCTLREFHTFVVSDKLGGKRQDNRNIETQLFTHGAFEDTEDGEEKWFMHTALQLPRSLAKCVQDCTVGPIKVRHKLRVSIQLHNPDGHTSELRASLPVQLFISPNHLMGDDNEIHSDMPLDVTYDVGAIPPRYDQHVYDRLWDDLPVDYHTPSASGTNTPSNMSRNNSSENLSLFTPARTPASLTPPDADRSRSRSRERPSTASSSGTTTGSVLSAADLHSSLSQVEQDTTGQLPQDPQESYFTLSRGRPAGLQRSETSRSTATTRSGTATRPSSPDNRTNPMFSSVMTPIEELSRVPSYQTAVKTNARSLNTTTAAMSALPRYDNAAPLSPPNSPPYSRETSPRRSAGRRMLSFTLSRCTHSRPQTPDSQQPQTSADNAPSHSHFSDLERRLRLRQSRGRDNDHL
ncbi:hypothetical protein DFH27DRAFT_317931 [Peziza echinospora]|nr:hypothetical protein DFH27DRAFT_317931 [Peziza echinospora]